MLDKAMDLSGSVQGKDFRVQQHETLSAVDGEDFTDRLKDC